MTKYILRFFIVFSVSTGARRYGRQVFWDVTLLHGVSHFRRFERSWFLHLQNRVVRGEFEPSKRWELLAPQHSLTSQKTCNQQHRCEN